MASPQSRQPSSLTLWLCPGLYANPYPIANARAFRQHPHPDQILGSPTFAKRVNDLRLAARQKAGLPC